MIITSRYWDWGDFATGLMVEIFERYKEALPFLLRRTGQTDWVTAALLSEMLGDLPLALAQAAAYVASRGITLAEYLELFEARRAELWQDESAPEAYPEPMAWSLSMEQLEAESPAKAHFSARPSPARGDRAGFLLDTLLARGGSDPRRPNPVSRKGLYLGIGSCEALCVRKTT